MKVNKAKTRDDFLKMSNMEVAEYFECFITDLSEKHRSELSELKSENTLLRQIKFKLETEIDLLKD